MKTPLLFLALASLAFPSTPTTSIDSALSGRIGWDSNPLGVQDSSAEGGINDAPFISAGATIGAKSGDMKASYSGEWIRFHDLASENYATHRFSLSSQHSNAPWQFGIDASSLYVDGSRDTLRSYSTVNANSLTLWRERRKQWQHRLKLLGQYTSDAWLVRSSVNYLGYDYGTKAVAGRVAFADRSDLMAAVDGGWKQTPSSLWLIGARVGHQDQAQVPLPNCAFDYTNDYARIAAGWEGKLAKNTTLAFTAGPDFRRYTGVIDARAFVGGRDHTSLWFDGTLNSKLTPRLTITGKAARMNWLSSTGKSALIDTCAETSLSYAANAKTTLRLGAKLHRCDYFPVVRDDYESLIGPGLTRKIGDKLSLSIDLVRHRAWNNLDAFPEREFTRTLLTFGATLQL